MPMTGGEWSLIKSPRGDWHTPLSVADVGPDTVVVGCLGGVEHDALPLHINHSLTLHSHLLLSLALHTRARLSLHFILDNTL